MADKITLKEVKCMTCKHYNKYADGIYPTCEALPKEIPIEIFFEEIDHTEPYPGDNGIQFEYTEK